MSHDGGGDTIFDLAQVLQSGGNGDEHNEYSWSSAERSGALRLPLHPSNYFPLKHQGLGPGERIYDLIVLDRASRRGYADPPILLKKSQRHRWNGFMTKLYQAV